MIQKNNIMITRQNKSRIAIFLALAFGISWATGLLIYLTGGLNNSPSLEIAGLNIPLSLVLLATAYMFGPAVANMLTRIITKEVWGNLQLRPYFDHQRWVHFLAGWFLPPLLIIAGAAIFFLIFPRFFDANIAMLNEQLEQAGGMPNINPWMIVVVQTFQAILISPLLNTIPTFGEEFGWRGYLQPKLMPLGGRKAVLWVGVIWGVWHWPVILMGHNYGPEYFGAPFLGPLAMVWFTLSLSIIFGWGTIKAGSVWPAVIAHGAVNGLAGISMVFIQGEPNTILGPTPVGVVGGVGLTLTALLLLTLPNALKPKGQV